MADKLIFPIGFDLEAAVKDAQSKGDKAIRDLEKIFSRQPLVLKTDTRGFAELLQDTDTLKARLKDVKAQFDKMPTSVKFDLDSEGRVKQLSADGKALWDELMRINTALQGVSMSATQLLRQNQREMEAEQKAEQKRQQAIAASLKAEYKRIEAKKQSEAASRRELEMLNRQYAAEERRQRLAASEASVSKRQKVINVLRAEENTIDNITAKLKHWESVMNSSAMDGKQFKRATEEVQRLSQKLSEAQARIAKLTSITTTESSKAASAVRQVTNEYRNQDGYVSRLIKRLGVYAAFSFAGQFLTNIREVTAQFELQRVSLGAIIQDQQRANQLFAEIKSFALTSPLKILDLTKYTKQVAAYGIETKKLFSTTKMLADISVGLGVDMSRLTLFLGQVYATGYLRASEVRQATEAGIPLVDKLAKKLSEANGKLVTAADVMDLISKRAISFEQVEEVFKDMTSAGGEFYNMQVKQSQTLFGMWSKLGDAAALMYDQIGNTSSVNSAMKTTIGLLEKMMRNWQTTGTLLSSLAIGMGTYALALKNASVASKALALAEAQALAAEKARVITTPKLVAAIIGQNTATKLSTFLTKAHTAAMIKQSVATNVLSRAFWDLSAAMLANPWAIALAAIVGAGYAVYQFATRVETAAERTEKLNNAVASLKNLDDTVKPLVDTYNELIDKTERTAAEEKKLSEVTHELAKRYPGAITAIGDFGNEVDLATDKLNKLYQAEKNVRMENTRYELEKTEKKIRETEDAIVKLEETLLRGEKTVTRGGGLGGYQSITVSMSEEDKGRVLLQINELRSGLVDLKEVAESTGEALLAMEMGLTVEALRIEQFGSWRKELQSFRKEMEGGVKIQLFDDSTITQFKSIDDAMEQAAKTYKENTELVERYTKALTDMTATAESRADAEKALAEAQEEQNLALQALTRFGYKSSDFDKSRGRGTQSDQRLSILQEMVSTLKQVNKEYDELAKKEGATKALADTQRVYADTFKNMQQLAAKYKFELPDFGVPTDTASLTRYLDAIKSAMAKLPKSDKAVLALQVDIEKLNIDDMQKKIEQKLKELSDKISRTKTAKEFYDKILSQTGDVDVAATLTMNVYGNAGEDLFQQTVEQLQTYFSGVEVDLPINFDTQQIDYKALRKLAERMRTELGEGAYKGIISIADNAEKDMQKMIEGWLKATEKAKTYSDKLLDLARATQTEINKITLKKGEAETRITELLGLGDLDADQQKELNSLRNFIAIADNLIQGFKDKQAKEQTALAYEAFKDSPMYVQLFDDLGSASTTMLNAMRDRLVSLKDEWKNLDPTQLKEMQKRLREIDEQLTSRNPFKALVKSLKEYRRLRTEGDSLKSKSSKEADEKLLAATKKRIEAEEEYLKLLKDEKATQEQIAEAKKKLDQAESDEKAAQKAKEVWQDVSITMGTATDTILGGLGAIGDIANGVADIMESLGADEEDVTYWRTIGSSISEITAGLQDVVQSVMKGDLMGVITGIITAIPKMFVGFVNIFNAGRIRRANKEIKRQQELLDQLQYTYSRLEKAAEKVFGADYLRNYNQQLRNLQAQQLAYEKQLQAEKSKGKKADKDKLKEYEEKIRDVKDEIADMQGKISEKMLGTDLTSAARDFAKAWIDAYKEVGRAGAETSNKMKEKFQDMIENMVVEGALAAVMQKALQPMFDMIDNMSGQDFYNESFWKKVAEAAQQGAEDADKGAQTLMKFLEQAGISVKDISTEYTGIKREVAGATSEEMNANTAALNTQNYYLSQVPGIAVNVALIRQYMETGASGGVVTTATGWTDWQQQAMDHYAAIQRNTAETVVECRRAAQAAENAVAALNRVITVKGSKHGVQVYM